MHCGCIKTKWRRCIPSLCCSVGSRKLIFLAAFQNRRPGFLNVTQQLSRKDWYVYHFCVKTEISAEKSCYKFTSWSLLCLCLGHTTQWANYTMLQEVYMLDCFLFTVQSSVTCNCDNPANVYFASELY